MDTIKAFFADYGYSFLMFVVIGFVVAIITEITIKKALNWLEGKLGEHEKLVALVNAVRTVLVQCVVWLMVIAFTKLVVDNMSLPGGTVLYPVWLCLVYIIQYVFSMYGIKGVLSAIKRHREKAAEPKPEPEKEILSPVPGTNNLYTNSKGEYVDRKGRKV